MKAAPPTNRLLDFLPSQDRDRVLAACEPVELVGGHVLAEAGDAIDHVYFPTGSFIALLAPMGGDDIIEVALAGREGLYGVPIALGARHSPVQALVQGAGPAWQLGGAAFRRELAATPSLRACVDRYVHVLLGQLAQAAGCTRFHVVEQRVARWLLMTADRSPGATLPITHEFLAHMLGVRRVGITQAATALQRGNLIRYTRGVVTIVDRKGLERASCRCYQADLSIYDTAFGTRPRRVRHRTDRQRPKH